MADIIPDTILGTIEFFEQRIADWTADPESIGLTGPQVGDLVARLSAARAAYNAAQASRQQARNDTATQTEAVRELRRLGSGLIAVIRAFADVSPDPVAVYDAAELDMPSPRGGPLPPPEPAADLSTALLNSGAVRVSWTGTVANGTFYDVYRELDGEAGFTQIGTSATRSFVDATVPAGTARALYFCIARRDELASGASSTAMIRFGVPQGQNQNQNQNRNGGQDGTLGLAA